MRNEQIQINFYVGVLGLSVERINIISDECQRTICPRFPRVEVVNECRAFGDCVSSAMKFVECCQKRGVQNCVGWKCIVMAVSILILSVVCVECYDGPVFAVVACIKSKPLLCSRNESETVHSLARVVETKEPEHTCTWSSFNVLRVQ